MWELCEAGAKGQMEEGELNLVFGAYLLARGKYLSESRKKFTASGASDAVAPMMAELEDVEAAARSRQWEESWSKLKLLIDQGDKNAARRFAKSMKQYLPEEYNRHESELQKLLQEE